MNRRLFLKSILVLSSSIVIISSCDKIPDIEEITDVPDYYFENQYLDNRVRVISKAIEDCKGDCEAFFWITDIHWESDYNTRHSSQLIKYISSKTGINKILNGGDTGNSQVICKNAITMLREAIGSDKVYSVNGNHEMSDASRYETPFLRVADELRGHNSDLVYGDDNKSYFYFENKEYKIRYIGLSAYGLYLNDAYESCYNREQLSWFKNIALNVDAGWTIIIFTHGLYYYKDITANTMKVLPTGANSFIEAIDNYKGKGIIACVLMGHTHRDRIHIGSSRIPYIITASDRYVPHNGDINVERVPGTISEQHFEVVVIDKREHQIKLFSVGAPARDGYDDNPGNEVDCRIVNY